MPPVLYKPPPLTPTGKSRGYGKYCIKASGKVITKTGKNFIDVTGFDTNLSIIQRVESIMKRKAVSHEMCHTEVQVIMIGQISKLADGTVFVNYLESGDTIHFPPDSFL